MPQNLITGWIQIATSGATVDGRTIEAQDLRDMAETYSPVTYTAVIRFEHIRYLGNFGDVAAVKAEDVGDGKVGLFAQLRPNQRLLELNREDQALFTSIEIAPDFAGTGKAYLNALAVTDEPASLGTQRLHFSRRRTSPDNYFAAPMPLPDLDECQPEAEINARAFFASLGRLLPGFNKHPKDENTPMDSKTVEAFAAAVDKLNTVASSLESSASRFASPQPQATAKAEVIEPAPSTEAITGDHFKQLKDSLDSLVERFNTALEQGNGQTIPPTTGAIDDNSEPVY